MASGSVHPFVSSFQNALYDFDAKRVTEVLKTYVSDDAQIRMTAPFGSMVGSTPLMANALEPLFSAWRDAERREYIQMRGSSDDGGDWIGSAGYYTGRFEKAWLDIPSTGHQAAMRFHEFFRLENDKVVEMQLMWDIPSVMMQASAWPMSPSLGLEWIAPAPSTQDGIDPDVSSSSHNAESLDLVLSMLTDLSRHPSEGGPEVMNLDRYWHEKMNWYGPAGVGTARGIKAFRDWHQIPFLAAMPDRGKDKEGTKSHFFAQGDYVAVTGWPNMKQTLSDGGWLGIPPTNKQITICSLDFWRVENGKIRENWVLFDLIDIYQQLGVDVFARMREFNKSRVGFDKNSGRAINA